MNNYFIRIC